MKVLHVLTSDVIGGGEIATRRIAEAVRPLGVESAALLLRPSRDLAAFFEEAGVPCFACARAPEPSLVRAAPRFLFDSWRAARLCARFDVVHCAEITATYDIAVAGRLARRPVICHVRNRESRMPRRNRVFVGAADHFAFVSGATRDSFPIRLPERRASVLYDGVDIPPQVSGAERAALAAGVRAEFGLPADAVVAAMFARLHPQKDFETLIRAARRLRDRHPRLRILVVGDHDRVQRHAQHFEQVRRAADAAGVLDRFVFAGFREDAPRLMAAADMCILCTHFEGLPLVLIEAMAAGRPCIATAVDGIPEVVADGVSGLLHAHADAEGLAAAIARLIEDPEMAEAMAARARAEVERRFSKQRFARDVHALYSSLVRTAR